MPLLFIIHNLSRGSIIARCVVLLAVLLRVGDDDGRFVGRRGPGVCPAWRWMPWRGSFRVLFGLVPPDVIHVYFLPKVVYLRCEGGVIGDLSSHKPGARRTVIDVDAVAVKVQETDVVHGAGVTFCGCFLEERASSGVVLVAAAAVGSQETQVEETVHLAQVCRLRVPLFLVIESHFRLTIGPLR